MATVSVIILARNEEHNIHDCIESVQFADEVLVIDDFSTDNTVTIAEEMGARVVQHAMNGDWGAQQTFGIEQAKSDWILFLDADERISEPLAKEIQDIVVNKPNKAYWIQRRNKFHHNHATHGVLRPDYVLRLMPKEGSYVEGYVHPAIITPYPTEKLQHPMYHTRMIIGINISINSTTILHYLLKNIVIMVKVALSSRILSFVLHGLLLRYIFFKEVS